MKSFPYGICCDTIVKIDEVIVPENIQNKVYEVMRIIDKKVLYFEEHMNRMEKSIRFYNPGFDLDRGKILELMKMLIESIEISEVNCRIEVYLNADGSIQLIGYLLPGIYPTAKMYDEGIEVKSLVYQRVNPNVKSINYNYKSTVNEFLRKEEIYEAILSHDNRITEGSRSNVFLIKNNQVYSAKGNEILSGITRKKVLETLKEMDISLNEDDIMMDELSTFEAAFITGTSIHILPISKWDDIEFNPQQPLLKEIMKAFKKTINRYLII